METNTATPFKKVAARPPVKKSGGINHIIEWLALVLAIWLGYQTWFSTAPLPSSQQAISPPALQSTVPAESNRKTITRHFSSPITTTEAPALERLERLASWQYDEGGSLNSLDINTIEQDLTRLAQLGPEAIPAIYQYLNSGQDVDFQSFGNGQHLSQPSLRLSLFKVLHRIGGDEAESIWFDELNHTIQPREISALGRYLDQHAPGQYQESILIAVRKALSLASIDGIDGQDAGPLFQLLAKHSDENTLTELQQLPQRWWHMYTTVALAGQPYGAGMTDLARQALDAPENNVRSRFALNMLAQHAEDAMAQSSLIELAGNKRISGRQWQELAQFLTGIYQIQIAKPAGSSSGIPISNISKIMAATPGGGQVLYGVRYNQPNLSDAQLAARLELLDALHHAAATPEAKQILAQAYELLWNSYEMAEASQQ